jgi:NAD(P)-dependent dehydrogenase (short-subunit alcohol dehydrogenase family)
MRIVISGANRGIGLEFVRQYLDRGDVVEAGVRNPERADELAKLVENAGGRLRMFGCDVTNDESVRSFAANVGDVPVDVLISNAGVIGDSDGFYQANFEEAMRNYDTNALGSIRLTRVFTPHLRRGSTRKIVYLSTGVASIGNTTTDMLLGYRMSKAALNMAAKVLSQSLSGERFTVLALHPGWVKTDMGGEQAPVLPDQSVAGMIAQIDRRGPAESGSFFDFTGKSLPW